MSHSRHGPEPTTNVRWTRRTGLAFSVERLAGKCRFGATWPGITRHGSTRSPARRPVAVDVGHRGVIAGDLIMDLRATQEMFGALLVVNQLLLVIGRHRVVYDAFFRL